MPFYFYRFTVNVENIRIFDDVSKNSQALAVLHL